MTQVEMRRDLNFLSCYVSNNLAPESIIEKSKHLKVSLQNSGHHFAPSFQDISLNFLKESIHLEYLVRNGNCLAEMKYRIYRFGDIINYVDFEEQTNDHFFLPKIRNYLKIAEKIINGKELLWTDVEMFLFYSKWPRECFRIVGDTYRFVNVRGQGNGNSYSVDSVLAIKKYILFRIGE